MGGFLTKRPMAKKFCRKGKRYILPNLRRNINVGLNFYHVICVRLNLRLCRGQTSSKIACAYLLTVMRNISPYEAHTTSCYAKNKHRCYSSFFPISLLTCRTERIWCTHRWCFLDSGVHIVIYSVLTKFVGCESRCCQMYRLCRGWLHRI